MSVNHSVLNSNLILTGQVKESGRDRYGNQAQHNDVNQPQTHSSYAVVMRYGVISAVYVGRFLRDWTSSVQGQEALLGGASGWCIDATY